MPLVFEEGFEGVSVPGWLMSADAPPMSVGTGWAPKNDSGAQANSQSLHYALASDSYEAQLPPLALSAGAWRVRLHARIDKDGGDCAGGALRVRRDGKTLPGGSICQPSGSMTALELPLDVTADGDVVSLTVVWTAVAAKPTPARGAWIDQVQISAEPAGQGCNCTP